MQIYNKTELGCFYFRCNRRIKKQSDVTAAMFINVWLITGSWCKLSQIYFALGESLLTTVKCTMKRGAAKPPCLAEGSSITELLQLDIAHLHSLWKICKSTQKIKVHKWQWLQMVLAFANFIPWDFSKLNNTQKYSLKCNPALHKLGKSCFCFNVTDIVRRKQKWLLFQKLSGWKVAFIIIFNSEAH